MIVAVAGMWAAAPRTGGNLMLLSQPGFCSGFELDSSVWAILRWRTPLRYAGVFVLVLALVAHWVSLRRDREPIGRAVARVSAVAILLVHGSGALTLALEVGVDRYCRVSLHELNVLRGVWVFLSADAALALAGLCALAAVRVPRHRLRRLVGKPWIRRGAAGVAAGGLLCFLPVADLATGPVTGREACGSEEPLALRNELGFLCNARRVFASMPDHLLLAYGRRQCAAYPHMRVDISFIVPICPAAARQWDTELAAEEAEIEQREKTNQAACDRSRHRPLIRAVTVAHERMWSETGLEVFEDHTETSDDDPFLQYGLVGSTRGRMAIGVSAESQICLSVETYRRRPPVEVKAWDKVIELGYESPGGDMVIVDPMAGPGGLPNLAYSGKGHYRVRVHYREPVWAADLPQHILVMVFPGDSRRTIAHKA
ncbi:hypothetical protein [Nonomuraea sp. NPDC050786]|uniref:hypothetical protein n=1 Tax=Nonomuraea sp. NPDC050786 TaxID=3154840 RepID=UPI0034049740